MTARGAYDDYQKNVTISNSSGNLYKFVAPYADWYFFSLDSYSNTYFAFYENGSVIADTYKYTRQIYMNRGDEIYVEVRGMGTYSGSVNLSVDGDGMSPAEAIDMSSIGSSYTATVEAGGHVWFKTSSSLDCYNYTWWFEIAGSNSGYKTATVYYEVNYGSYSSVTSGYTSSTDMSITLPATSDQRVYYILISCTEATEITVSYDYNY